MYLFETSDSVYNELKTLLNKKGLNCLDNVRMACDIIVSAKGNMNFSRVGDIATIQFGSPKKQSIQNSPHLKRYIQARITEYHRDSTRLTHQPNVPTTEVPLWPEKDLSPRTRTYINQLRTRLEMIEKRYSDLRISQEKITKSNPVSLSGICGDPQSMVPTQCLRVNSDYDEVRQSVRALLNICEYINSLQTETINSRTGLVLKRPSGDVVILTPAQYDSLKSFLSD